METIYYNLDARRVTVRDIASGEDTCSYACINTSPRTEQGPGVVLDMDAYRHHLPNTPDGEGEFLQPTHAEEGSAQEQSPPRRVHRGISMLLEICACLFVIAMAWVMVSQFLHFL